ncbi:single-stranded DNA-binding protein [Lancefieldella parvula]|uniref:single-stranded DNA-binding protein n=1 Tax=Lancefieldella parvula TaxID=1382 RepID=UPI002889310A|nr:single-stranded DNA-binding protein [Lancefieldella parvula]
MSINRVNITGNLTRDPELRATAGGTQILAFGVAVNDRRRNQQTGEWEDVPNFVDCIVFGSRAEAVSRFITKGSKVAIEGKLRFSAWETKEGQRRSKLEVVVDEIEFLSRANGQQVTSPAAEAAKVADTPAYVTPRAPEPEFYDADIPF